MSNRPVAILDIGSSKMRVLIGVRGVNNTFHIFGQGESEYSGFMDGEFVDAGELKYAVGLAISNAETNSGLKIRELCIGVPAEFSLCETNSVNQNYPKRIKVTEQTVMDLFEKAVNEKYGESYALISCSPVYFVLADNRKVIEAIGQKTNRLSALVSVVYVENKFIELFNQVLRDLEIESCEYVSGPLAEAVYLLKSSDKDKFALIVDAGYISTSVALVRGKGMLLLCSFSLGGGHISADLSRVLNIPFQSAESLKQKIVLSVSPEKNDVYEITIGDKVVPINMQMANNIVASRLDQIALAINKCIGLCKQEYPEFIDVSLTGGGLSYIKGAKDFIAKSIGRNVKLIAPSDPEKNKPYYSSVLGLLDYAIEKTTKKKKRFLAK